MSRQISRIGCVGLALTAVLAGASARGQSSTPVINPDFASSLSLSTAFNGLGFITQMAWGPDGRLYASRYQGGAVSLQFDPVTGKLGDLRQASDISGLGIAFAPDRGEMYLTAFDSIWRLTNAGGNSQWGSGPTDTKVAIVTNIPVGNHQVDQVQVSGNSLYVGIGTRTLNGRTDASGPEGESAYSGTISWIRDISQVASTTDAARLLGPVNATTIQTDATPFTSTAADKLVVHSAGARNPYGLALDANGDLFFTNNFNRSDTHGDGTFEDSSTGDQTGPDLSRAVHDQFFKAVQGGDYGFTNDNWRGVRDPSVKAAILDPSDPAHTAVRSVTPDNLFSTDPNYLQLHDPANPVGLGPSSSADGLAFWYADGLPAELRGDAFIARWSTSVTESAPGTDTIPYADLVAADPLTGEVKRVASGFGNPLAVLADNQGRLFVSDFTGGQIYVITAVPEPGQIVLAGLLAATGLCVSLMKPRRARANAPARA